MDDGWRWVQHPVPLCRKQGCSYEQLLRQAMEAVRMSEELLQDVALWCGVGGHAFSPRDPGRQRVTVEQWDADALRMAPVIVAACGDHARPVQIRTRPTAALNGGTFNEEQAHAVPQDS